MIPVFSKYTLTIVTPTYKVSMGGGRTEDWSNPVRTVIQNCAIQGGTSTEDNERASAVIDTFTVWAPLNADIDADAKVEFNYGGRFYDDFQVDGTPVPMEHPIELLSHQVFELRKRTG